MPKISEVIKGLRSAMDQYGNFDLDFFDLSYNKQSGNVELTLGADLFKFYNKPPEIQKKQSYSETFKDRK